ncbi:hypothetical protein GCM10012275_39680 [Longimycelium tulufanense]|uniref:Uncharacterized protein n=1 Tax=Longimycelium tulufanense TaxID=907463 RepID=A0A8J3FWC6_9PSEU|nr:hypothetical protein GCM10012275_39680 [Longimycelium tulufanense]
MILWITDDPTGRWRRLPEGDGSPLDLSADDAVLLREGNGYAWDYLMRQLSPEQVLMPHKPDRWYHEARSVYRYPDGSIDSDDLLLFHPFHDLACTLLNLPEISQVHLRSWISRDGDLDYLSWLSTVPRAEPWADHLMWWHDWAPTTTLVAVGQNRGWGDPLHGQPINLALTRRDR